MCNVNLSICAEMEIGLVADDICQVVRNGRVSGEEEEVLRRPEPRLAQLVNGSGERCVVDGFLIFHWMILIIPRRRTAPGKKRQVKRDVTKRPTRARYDLCNYKYKFKSQMF